MPVVCATMFALQKAAHFWADRKTVANAAVALNLSGLFGVFVSVHSNVYKQCPNIDG